jgi:hypothetical protein
MMDKLSDVIFIQSVSLLRSGVSSEIRLLIFVDYSPEFIILESILFLMKISFGIGSSSSSDEISIPV